MAYSANDCKAPVFVVGAARSGTTLVQSLLTALPGFYSCPETHFFDELMPRVAVFGGYQMHRPALVLPPQVDERHLRESLDRAEAGFLKVPIEARDDLAAKARAGRLTPKEYLCGLIEACSPSAAENRLRWVEKTPIHSSYLRQIFALFPDARIVCVRRRPEEVLRSAAKTFGIPACIVALDYYRSYRDVTRFLIQHPEREAQIHYAFYDKIMASDESLGDLIRFVGAEDVPPFASLRNAVKEEFAALYRASAMASIQASMGGAAAQHVLGWWRSRAIAGYAALLERTGISTLPPHTRGCAGVFSSLLPMATDLVRGAVYWAEWRARSVWQNVRKWLHHAQRRTWQTDSEN